MKNNQNKPKFNISIFLMLVITVFTLSIPISVYFFRETTAKDDNQKMVTTTTTMLQDLVAHLIGDVDEEEQDESNKYQKIDNINYQNLMGVGIDPHNYKTKLSDRQKIKNTDLLVVSGLHLEAKMPDAFRKFTKPNSFWDAGKKLKKDPNFCEKLLKDEEDSSDYDPHIWFSPELWIQTFSNLKDILLEKGIVKKADKTKLENNFNIYNNVLNNLKIHIINKMKELKTKMNVQRNELIIVTAHDAFSYWQSFCESQENCSFELEPIQGISTQTEASNNTIVTLATKLANNDVKAIFTESSMPKDSLKSLKEEVDSQRRKLGKIDEIKIPENVELYSDSLGIKEKNEEFDHKKYKHSTYVGAYLNNIKVIQENL